MRVTKEELKDLIVENLLSDRDIDKMTQGLILLELVKNDIKRCRGELSCPANEKLADHLQQFLEESKT